VQNKRAVLVIDHDPQDREFLVSVLTVLGYQVRSAASGRDALAMLSTWRPHLLLVDTTMMASGGTAFLAAKQARPQLHQLPTIVMTASWTSKTGELLPPVAFLPKPLAVQHLLECVSALTS
jgi:two-component system, NtrC family, response regulator GlrR